MSRSKALPFVTAAMLPASVLGDQLPGTLNFADVTADRIVATVGENSGNQKHPDFGDFDNDGDLDVVIAVSFSDFGQRRNKLYRNDDGIFVEVSGAPAIPGFDDTDVSRYAFLRDYDGDGWLDIYVINVSNAGPGPGTDRVYINVQQDGRFLGFVDESDARLPDLSMSGCAGPGCTGAADGGITLDADNDGDFDVYFGNEANSSQDRLFFNDGNGFFVDVTFTHVPIDGDYVDDVSSSTCSRAAVRSRGPYGALD